MLPLLYGFIPLSSQPLQFLENRIKAAPIANRQIDGIIVLGGFTGDGMVANNRNQPSLGSAAERFTAALKLHQIFPAKPLIFIGLSQQNTSRGKSEAAIIQQLLIDAGVDSVNIQLENTGQNIFESAASGNLLMAPTPGSHWLLITSAARMPRAIGSFRAAGWTGVLGYPVDYQTPSSGHYHTWDINKGVNMIRIAYQEYVCLLIYWLTGRSTDILPS